MDTQTESADDCNRQGLDFAQAGRFADAVNCFRKAVNLDPFYANAQNNLGAAHLALEQYDLAVPALEAAARIEPHNVDTRFNLGIASWKTGRPQESLVHFSQVVALAPGFADAHYNLGILLSGAGRYEEAIESFRLTIALRPGFAPAHENLGMALACVRKQDEAITSLGRALQLDPGNAMVRAQRMYLLAGNCDWDALANDLSLVPQLGVSMGIVPPFGMIALEDEPDRHLVRAQRFSAEKYKAEAVPIAVPTARPERLKIGYFSADLHMHATMVLAAGLFEAHDRSRFAVHAFSYGPDVADAMRQRALTAFDFFTEIGSMSDAEAAALARAEGIDIAVDLKGYTEGSRLGIFAHRAAPLQVTFLGYPGTTGAPFIDYLIADPVVIPRQWRKAYSEKLILMPEAYQPNDHREVSGRTWKRSEAGLPDKGFVFCSFNNSYKIGPREFDIWMRLLGNVEGSVLWLLAANVHVERNLRAEAKRRGVDPQRLVFAPRAAMPDHLARHALADLFLDTFACNAHTTASDALWAGLPLVTRLGDGFAARVAASLLRATGLGELVTDSDAGYEALALDLARSSKTLAALRQKLVKGRDNAPLFDCLAFARAIEAGYDMAFDRLVKGKKPADIIVPPGSSGAFER